MENKILKTNSQGYGYKYTDLAGIHEYLESVGASYYQYIETVDGADFVVTVPIFDGKELPPRRGCRVVLAVLAGKNNPAQEQGSALTYARRYSLLMAFGLATDDDDASELSRPVEKAKSQTSTIKNFNMASESQINYGKRLGLDVSKMSVAQASEAIDMALDKMKTPE